MQRIALTTTAALLAGTVLSACADPSRPSGPALRGPSRELSAPASSGIVRSVVKAPVTPDGDVAGRRADIVINLDISLDPAVPGRTLRAGRTIRVTLPDEFVNDLSAPLKTVGSPGCAVPVPATCSTVALLQGWPQHPISPPKYPLTLEGTNTIVITAASDITPATPLDPGIKQIHLVLNGFTNPPAGEYQISVVAETGPDGSVESGRGTIEVLATPRPTINPTSNFSLPPGLNAIYQETTVGGQVPRDWDFLLFGADGGPLLGVSVVPASGDSHETSDALLVRDGATIGRISISAPAGATGQTVWAHNPSSPVNAPVTGVPAALLKSSFQAGSLPGEYVVTFELDGGNSMQMFVRVRPDGGT